MSKPILINLYGGPGAGKTTTAMRVTGELKALGFEAEYIPEYARDLSLEERLTTTPQFDILMEQAKRILRTVGTGIEVIVTDSPVLLQSLYSKNEADRQRAVVLHTALATVFNMLNYVVLNGREKHSMVGRVTTREEAMQLDRATKGMLVGLKQEFVEVPKSEAFDVIMSDLCTNA